MTKVKSILFDEMNRNHLSVFNVKIISLRCAIDKCLSDYRRASKSESKKIRVLLGDNLAFVCTVEYHC